ncbi:aspartate/tyrosine/aromatic aminotransferase [Gilvimarinus agarilyticus]|uniref:amino acid aminotransferase n=1 Tax=unclassified Gilvimarinus TaxID=2642066 RepID=UPI001C089D86|nr:MULTISPECIES: amino acid aminotransferase [unclassified Gilvimarinus]MBU2887605.1 aspartate/tyrosine/aromatic aminotransferase [Gilvimarinus agarilyticus]MDO6572256.1 amino acid aminotransferase [Gilvimarinus sp. 2_MG-2023]MDO6746823.1 amino acid aminotransferase [Gilvimarinus sp. 1_MG-2023]
MFNELPLLPADPILGLSASYKADPNPLKVDLGVGVYKTEAGLTPVLAAVSQAEAQLLTEQTSKSYTSPAGIDGANFASQQLAFGTGHRVLIEQRVATVQTPGGCGALRLAAELIKKSRPDARIWVSTPTWANHIPLLGNAGLELIEYPYYDFAQHAIDFDAMHSALSHARAGDLVLLHACCHNPSGADLNREQWQSIAELAHQKGFTPFIDMAYQGFGEGIEQDAFGVRTLAEQLPELVLATSYSKNLGLYRERAGSLSVVSQSASQAQAVQSQVLSIARGLYSMPPAHGAAIVDRVYHDDTLNALWLEELTAMRQRIQQLRQDLVAALAQESERDFSFIQREQGMFSFLGLSSGQVQRLKQEFSVYMTDNSRINIAGISASNLPYLARAISKVL